MSADQSSVDNLQAAIKTLKDTPEVQNFLRICASDAVSKPSTSLVFPRFLEDSPDIPALAEFLWMQAINYVIPLHRRKNAQNSVSNSTSGGDLSETVRLMKATKRAFLTFSDKNPGRASEVGELLAYLIALEYLNAPQIASKMALKTNGNMPIHGLDGIHIAFEGEVMILYFLESKLSGSANAGAAEYAESVGGFGTNRKQYLMEYDILSDLGNLDTLNAEDKKSALEYLDIYGSKKSLRIERSIGVICYTESNAYKTKLPKSISTPPMQHEENFKVNYESQLSHHQSAVAKHLEKNGVDTNCCEVYFVAFPDVNEIRDEFYKAMND